MSIYTCLSIYVGMWCVCRSIYTFCIPWTCWSRPSVGVVFFYVAPFVTLLYKERLIYMVKFNNKIVKKLYTTRFRSGSGSYLNYCPRKSHTFTFFNLTMHLNTRSLWHAYVISRSQMWRCAARSHSVTVAMVCRCICCGFHNRLLLSDVTPGCLFFFPFLLWGRCDVPLCFPTCPGLNFSCQCVSMFPLLQLCLTLFWCLVPVCTVERFFLFFSRHHVKPAVPPHLNKQK